MANTDHQAGTGSRGLSQPVPPAADFKQATDDLTAGANAERDPCELQAACGDIPHEGPRAEGALNWSVFQSRYDAWKAATMRFEAAVGAMRNGSAEGREEAQALALELARLHHSFMESSQPYFRASKVDP